MSIAWFSTLWPGLPRLWYRGEVEACAIALLFAALLNIAIVATIAWPEWLAVWFVRGLWLCLAGWSLYSAASQIFSTQLISGRLKSEECDELLATAQRDYLKGNYFEAEASLHRILTAGNEDIEAALLFATVLRRSGRFRQAFECLERIQRLDRASHWGREIAIEKALIEKASIEKAAKSSDSNSPALIPS